MKTLEQIEVGDRVWVRTGQYGRRLRRVERLTPKQIILDGLIEYSRFERGKPSRYPHLNVDRSYNRIGRTGFDWERIVAVATPEECAEWDAEQKRKADEATARERAEEAHKAKRAELNLLFPSERVYVHGSDDERRGEWHLNIYGSEDDMRRFAEVLRDVVK